jgi:hypothetical protein
MRRLTILLLAVIVVAAAGLALAAWHDTKSAALPPGTLTLVGDSLNVGVEPFLRAQLPGWTIHADDEVGRPTAAGVDHLRVAGTTVAPYVVVSLGTNDPSDAVAAFRASVGEVLALAGPDRCVVWPTIHRDGNAYDGFAAVLRDAADRNRNLRLVDWAALVDAHPDWLAADGIHGSPLGYRERARAIVEQLRLCPRRANSA